MIYNRFAEDIPSNPVPEPSTCLFFIVGLLGMLGIRKNSVDK
ncbi:MAG: PEP-CTERM sorting domain-containing protein [bacterium]